MLAAVLLPSWMSSLLTIPWFEEVVLIIFTAVVYISTHRSIKSARLVSSEKKTDRGAETSRAEASADLRRDVRTTTADHARTFSPGPWAPRGVQQPRTWMEIQGVTDCRFAGRIISFKPSEGYGFIQCPELHEHFGRDVFLHRLQVANFEVGNDVTFGVFLNKHGQPQAKELEAVTRQEAAASVGQLQAFAADFLRSTTPRPAAVHTPAPVLEPKRPLNPHAKLFAPQPVGVVEPPAPELPGQLNPYAKLFPCSQLKAWAEARPTAEALQGVWEGDRGSTYEVYLHDDPVDGQTVGTALRRRSSGAKKTFSICWDPVCGQLLWNGSFTLDLEALAENPKLATWWRGDSHFTWEKLTKELEREERDWEEGYRESAWNNDWYSEDQEAERVWSDNVQVGGATGRSKPHRVAKGEKHWVPKCEAY